MVNENLACLFNYVLDLANEFQGSIVRSLLLEKGHLELIRSKTIIKLEPAEHIKIYKL